MAMVPAPHVQSLRHDGGMHVLDYRCQGHPGQTCWQDRHRQWAVILAGAGGFVYRTGGQTHLIEPGMAILTRPGEAYGCEHPFGTGDEALVVTLPEPAMGATGWGQGRSAVLMPDVAAAARLTAAARHDRWQILPAVAALLATSVPVPGTKPDVDDLHSGHALLTRLAACVDDAPSLTSLGERVGLSRFGVNRLVRRLTGQTPHQYRIRQRLTVAAHLLSSTDRPVTAVAADAGWEDLSTFLHAFRQHFGCTPGTFRRQA
jgi:AraC-like DNA-binding protein